MNSAVPPSSRNATVGILAISASVLLFSLMSVFIKQVSDHIPVAEIVFFRCLIGLLPAVIAVGLAGGVAELRTRRFGGHVVRAAVGVTAMSLMFWSFALLPLADATAVNFTAPLFLTALSAPLLGEKVGVYRWGAVLTGFVGMLIMLRPGEGMLDFGSLVALGAALMQAFAMVAVSQLSRTEAAGTIVFYFTGLSALLFAVPLPFIWVTPAGHADWLMLLGVGVTGGCAQLCLTHAYAHARAVVLAPFTYASLLWAALFGWLLWGDLPDNQTLVGAALVAAGGLFIVYREARKKSSPQPPPDGSAD